MKQINIFNEVDHIDDDGNIKRCKVCKKSIDKGNLCSCRCVKKLIKSFVSNNKKLYL